MTRFQASIVLFVLAVHWISFSNGFFNWRLSRKVSQNTKEIDQLENRMIEYETKTKELEIKLEAMTEKGELDQLWEKYKTKFEKQYEEGEEGIKRAVWESNYHKIQQHNADYEKGLVSYTLGENDFTDLTVEEFSKRLMSTKNLNELKELNDFVPPTVPTGGLPTAVSYRSTEYVQPALDQGIKTTCWAFAATGLLESYLYKTQTISTELSVRQIVDNTYGTFHNNFWQGGYATDALEYIIKNGYKIAKVQDNLPYYRYVPHVRTTVPIDKQTKLKPFDMTGFDNYDAQSEDWMERMLYSYGPILGAMYVDSKHLKHFSKNVNNIYEDSKQVCPGKKVNHEVLITGYGILNGTKYWEVKNSWGLTWGDIGYMKILKGKNICGIEEEAHSIYVKKTEK